MMKLFAKANEKFVKAVVLYPNSSNVLCYDSDATDKVPGAMVKNLFEKGLLLVRTSDGDFRPTAFTYGENYYAVSLVIMVTSGQTTAAEELTFKSDTVVIPVE